MIYLYSNYVNESCFPSCWKQAYVVPVFKNSGERSDSRNYRPISLLPIISKVFESLINSSLTRHLESFHLLSDHQYSFRSGRSTADALTVLSERVYRSLNAWNETRAIALDISKAFDKVWHCGLLHKLKSYGISGTFLDLFRSFLTGTVESLRWFLMVIHLLHILSTQVCFKGLLLVPLSFSFSSMIFLIVFSVNLLSS